MPTASAHQPRRPSCHALGVGAAVGAAQQRGGGQLDVLEDQPAGRGGADAHAGIGLDADASGLGLDDEQGWAFALELGGDDEQLAVGRAGDERLDAVEHVPAAGGTRGGVQREGVEQRVRLHDRQRRGRDVLAHERGQVGGLLLGVAPQAERGRDRGRGQAGDGDAHVALGQRLAHQHGGGRGALRHGTAELLGDADHGQAELVGLTEQLIGCGTRRVGLAGDGPQPGEREVARGAAQQLLLVGGLEVEQVIARAPRLAGRTREALGGGEGASGLGGGAAGRLAGAVQQAHGGLAQPEPVDGRGGGDLVERAQADGHAAFGDDGHAAFGEIGVIGHRSGPYHDLL